MYEISLVKIHPDASNMDYDYEFFMSYNWPEIPVKGDQIHIKENEVFVVKGRLFPSTEISNKVVLFGESSLLFKSGKYTEKL